jgi:hypothetical protein
MRLLLVIALLLGTSRAGLAFDRQLWQAPIIAERPGAGTVITVVTPPAGLYLRRTLDPLQRYRLRLRGRGDPMHLRFQADDAAYSYQAAPAGSIQRVIHGASRIEILLYAESPGIYLLEAATIEECSDCQSAADLKARILAEAPDVAAASGLDKAVAVSRWAVASSILATDRRLVPSDFESWPAEQAVYELFDRSLGGALAGGQAVFLTRILALFEVDAFTVGYGIRGTPVAHVSVVVPHGGRHYLIDPAFAVTYLVGDRPLDLDQALRLLRSGDAGAVTPQSLAPNGRKVIGVRRGDPRCSAFMRTPAGLGVCRTRLVRRDQWLDQRQWHVLLRHGHRPDALLPLRLMRAGLHSVGHGRDPGSRRDFIRMLAAHGIDARRN